MSNHFREVIPDRGATFKLEERHVRLIVATAGLLGLFTGGFLGVALHQLAFKSGSELFAGSIALGCALGFAYLIVLAVRFVLTPEADHLRAAPLLKAWGACLIALYVLAALLPAPVLESSVFQAAEALAVWTAGVLAARSPRLPPR